ncbi:pyrroloquinoline quinone biosynthesis peptide chaperone PqqD [Flavisphingomonas formosensis]|uniref:pyrroloquinoline quinone biosynthesis peptide chaperone PqqD n=1 Tax=Flavisphingomonas formosensis TaxID=861534 RepID=UPI0018E0412C|nr:pyrroloquinoline quinone biosynthesis peptide chaperone PqqD [Sphingomonas formosensis]
MSGGEDALPRFRRGVRFRFDEIRQQWTLLAPEKLFLPDETGTEILKLVDGERSAGAIIDDLAARFDAPRDVIATDVLATLDDLAARGALTL